MSEEASLLPKFDYHLDESDPDVAVLRRQDGAFVATFSARGPPGRASSGPPRRTTQADRRRARFQDMAADGLIAFDELREKLAALEETRQLVRRELGILQDRRERLENLERDKAALLERYAGMVPGELDDLGPEERNRVYKMLSLSVTVRPSGVLEISGTFGGGLELSESDPTRASGAKSSARPSPTRGSGGWSRSAGTSPATRSSSTSMGLAASAT